jgi:CheY-like chemotaxis protein
MKDKKKVLVVDDEPEIVILVKSRLEANGFATASAKDGAEALEKAVSEKPDIVLLDLLMPRMDGYETMKQMRKKKETQNIPVILFTAAPPEEVIKKGDDTVEAIDFVIKPFDDGALQTLLKKIRQLTKSD